MTNYWYAARPNEIFCDLDSKKSLLRALRVVRSAIIEREQFVVSAGVRERVTSGNRLLLDVRTVHYYPTTRPGHGHLIITLNNAYDAETRARWALWLGSDRLRACYVLQRIAESCIYSADLLVTSRKYHREPDQRCACKEKHKTKKVTDHCAALRRLIGSQASADYFPRVGTARKIKPFRVPIGKISKTKLIRWENHG